MSDKRKLKLKKRSRKRTAWQARRRARELAGLRQREGRLAPFFDDVRQLLEVYVDATCEHEASGLFDLLRDLEIEFVGVPLEGGTLWRVYAADEFPGVRMAVSGGWARDEMLAALEAAPADGLVASEGWGKLLGLPAVAETPAGVS